MCRDCGCSSASHPLFLAKHNQVKIKGFIKPKRTISVEESIFQKNQKKALQNRDLFQKQQTCVMNVMSSPGSGKTTLLAKILGDLKNEMNLAVFVGDQETSIDRDRYAQKKIEAHQINTHAACHLNAQQIGEMLPKLTHPVELLVIENVGNLVCPAVFDLGEEIKVALLSTPEGEEKPLKYPVLFHDADIIILTKIDLINALEYNLDLVIQNIRSLNSHAPLILCSSKTGEGLDELKSEIKERIAKRNTHVLSTSGHP